MRIAALLFCLSCVFSDTVCAQAAPAVDSAPPYRDPTKARVLGTLIPGAGHVYAGEYVAGARYYAGTVGVIGGGVIALALGGPPSDEATWPLRVSGVLLIGLGAATWVRSSLDAPRAAARANAKHNHALADLSLLMRAGSGAGRSTDVGLSAAW